MAIQAEGLKPRLVFSPTRVDFGTQIVQRSRQIKVPYSSEIRVLNNDDTPIRFRLHNSAEENPVFNVKPSEVVVSSKDEVTLTVHFLPREAELYEQVVPVVLDDEEAASMELNLTGTGQYPRLRFDQREVILPAVSVVTGFLGTECILMCRKFTRQ